MRLFRLLTLYTALSLGAIGATFVAPAPGFAAEHAEIAALRSGSMKKLNFHSEPKEVSQAEFTLEDGKSKASLADFKGKYVVLNFWATWCAPCRKEMPYLSDLQSEFGGEDFMVLTLATGRNPPAGITKFFDEIGVTNLPKHTDAKQALAREMGVFGLPITVILNPEGKEIARLQGDAEWYSDSARAIIAALLDRPSG